MNCRGVNLHGHTVFPLFRYCAIDCLNWLEFFVVYASPSRKMLGWQHKICHYRNFLLLLSQFFILHSVHFSTSYNLRSWKRNVTGQSISRIFGKYFQKKLKASMRLCLHWEPNCCKMMHVNPKVKNKYTCEVHHICLSTCNNPRSAKWIYIKCCIMKAEVCRRFVRTSVNCTRLSDTISRKVVTAMSVSTIPRY
jgi:hypothetical protein